MHTIDSSVKFAICITAEEDGDIERRWRYRDMEAAVGWAMPTPHDSPEITLNFRVNIHGGIGAITP